MSQALLNELQFIANLKKRIGRKVNSDAKTVEILNEVLDELKGKGTVSLEALKIYNTVIGNDEVKVSPVDPCSVTVKRDSCS